MQSVVNNSALRNRRGFTLIEMLMAATLGAIVAAACFGLFAAITRADQKSKARTDAAETLSRMHRTLQRSMRTVLLDLPRQRPAGSTDLPDEPPKTRVSLSETSDGLQRLEVTLSQPPIMGLVAGRPADPVSRYMPVRGAFEMRRTPTAASLRQGVEPPIELWWVPIDPDSGEPNTDAQVRVGGGIAAMAVRFAKTNEQKQLEKMRTASFTDWGQIPAYVEVQVQTLDGTRADWMLEVSGTTGSEPGSNQADADLPAAVAERFRTALAARSAESADGGGRSEASGGTNSSSGGGGGRDTASSGTNSGSGGSGGTGSGGGSGGGSASSGGSGGSGTGGGGGAPRQPTIAELIAEFYRRLAERDANGGQ